MPTLTLRLALGVLAVIALLGGAAIVSADDGGADATAIEWMHDRTGDHDHETHHDGHADHDHGAHHDGANHSGHHDDHEPGDHHAGAGGC